MTLRFMGLRGEVRQAFCPPGAENSTRKWKIVIHALEKTSIRGRSKDKFRIAGVRPFAELHFVVARLRGVPRMPAEVGAYSTPPSDNA